MTKFHQLSLKTWRQFEHIDIDVDPRLTILTGANGAGKSTLLGIFSQHFGYQRPYLATPRRIGAGSITFFAGAFARLTNWIRPKENSHAVIGSISYDNSKSAQLLLPSRASVQFDLNIDNQQTVLGFHVSSHRSQYTYQQVMQIPTRITPSQAFTAFDDELRSEFSQGRWNNPPTFHMKQALIAMAMFGEGNSTVHGDVTLKRAYDGFVSKLSELLPKEIGFVGLEIRMPDVVLRTTTGEFLLDASSGGLMSLIDLAWRIYMYSLHQHEFVVTMDEPENHLHPSMQRALLPSLLKAFPKVQFIVATHSPFMVSSVRDSSVYALRFEKSDGVVEQYSGAKLPIVRSVVSVKLDTTNKAGDASAILREVLGMPTTIPDWVAEDIEEIALRYSKQPFTTETLKELRSELKRLGMGEFYPNVVAQVTPGHD